MNARVIPHLARGVWLELLRRRDLALVLAGTACLVLLVLGARLTGIENPATGTFLLNLVLGWAWLGSHLATLLLAARQMPDEMERRTLHTLLARPVRRAEVVFAKWVACWTGGSALWVLLAAAGWLAAPHLEPCDPALLIQAALSGVLSLAVASALALALSLLVTRALCATLAAAWFLVGSHVPAWADAWSANRGAAAALLSWLLHLPPDATRFNLVTRYTDGLPAVGALEFAGLFAYAALFTAFLLALSIDRFERRTV